MRSTLLLLVALFFVSPAANAWHDDGHKLTAHIAFAEMDERIRLKVAGILRAHPRFEEDFAAPMPEGIANSSETDKARWMFEQASIWPDLVQQIGDEVRDEHHRSTWHYINLPVFLTEADEKALAGKLEHNVSMEFVPPLQRGQNIVQALQGNLLVWGDANLSDADKAVALCWIVHLTGDMHQPLHNVALFSTRYFPEGDRGGNSIAVKRKPENTNLHAVWDGLLKDVKHLSDDEQTKNLLSNDVADIDAIGGWSRRGYELAKQFVYTGDVREAILVQEPGEEHPLIRLSPGYIADAKQLVNSQVIIAGHRIAALIADNSPDAK